jgi:Cu+-exporting ATPase
VTGYSEDDAALLGRRRTVFRAPLALAIVEAAKARNVALLPVSDFDSPTGRGAMGTVEGKRIVLGNARFLTEQNIDTAPLASAADELRREGATAIFVGIDGQAGGAIAIADPVKLTTPEALEALRREGIRVVMLTGDNRTTAEAVARGWASTSGADVLPDQKSAVAGSSARAGWWPWRVTA